MPFGEHQTCSLVFFGPLFRKTKLCGVYGLKLSTRSTTAPSMWMGVCLALHFLVVHNQLLVLLTLRERLLSWHHTVRSLTTSFFVCLIVIGDRGVQERTKHPPMSAKCGVQ